MKTQTEMNVNDQKTDTYIGIDAAKETLDAYRTHDKARYSLQTPKMDSNNS